MMRTTYSLRTAYGTPCKRNLLGMHTESTCSPLVHTQVWLIKRILVNELLDGHAFLKEGAFTGLVFPNARTYALGPFVLAVRLTMNGTQKVHNGLTRINGRPTTVGDGKVHIGRVHETSRYGMGLGGWMAVMQFVQNARHVDPRVVVHDDEIVRNDDAGVAVAIVLFQLSLVFRQDGIQGIDGPFLCAQPSFWFGRSLVGLFQVLPTNKGFGSLFQPAVFVFIVADKTVRVATMSGNAFHLTDGQVGTTGLFRIIGFGKAQELTHGRMRSKGLFLNLHVIYPVRGANTDHINDRR